MIVDGITIDLTNATAKLRKLPGLPACIIITTSTGKYHQFLEIEKQFNFVKQYFNL